MIHENSCKSFKPNVYGQKFGEYVWELILKVQGNSRIKKKLDQAKVIHMGPLSRESGFSVAAQGV